MSRGKTFPMIRRKVCYEPREMATMIRRKHFSPDSLHQRKHFPMIRRKDRESGGRVFGGILCPDLELLECFHG